MARTRKGTPIGRPRNAEKWSEIQRLRESGMSQSSIARLVGMHSTSVIYVLQRLGDPLGPSRNPNRKTRMPTKVLSDMCWTRNREWRRLYEIEKWTITEISAAYDRHFVSVARGLKAVGTPMRTALQSSVRSEKKRQEIKAQIKRVADKPHHIQKRDRIERMMQIVSRRKDWAA